MSGSAHRSPSLPAALLGARPAPPRADLASRARHLAALLLSSSGDRWRHTRTVAQRAALAVPAVVHEAGPAAGEALLAAAWLHDVGYAAPLVRTGFHPLDGAAHLRATGWPEEVVLLVAHHSGSRFVAGARGLGGAMAEYDDERGWASAQAQALTWADQTTGPTGRQVTVTERLAEVQERHGPGSPLARCHGERGPSILLDAVATAERMARHPGALPVVARGAVLAS